MAEETIYEADPKQIQVNIQPRKNFSPKAARELEDSIERVGQIQPGVCKYDGSNSLQLVAGERRLRACKALGLPFKYYLKEDIRDAEMLLEIQLEENLRREDLTWQEEAQAKADLHELRQRQHGETRTGRRGGWGLKKTADELGESVGAITEDIELSKFAEAFPEVADAKTKAEAKKIIKRIKADFTRAETLEKATAEAQSKIGGTFTPGHSGQEDLSDSERSREGMESSTVVGSPSLSAFEAQLLEFDKRCILGTLEDCLPDFEDESIDIVLFDPPWGVNYDKVMRCDGGKQKYCDDAEKFREDFPQWLRLIYRKMAANSHLYLFFGITWHQFVYDTLEDIGFSTNRMPLIWHKRGSHVTRNPTIWPGRSYEPIAYARKGSKDIQRPGAPDVISTSRPTPKLKENHPSAKHPDVYIELLERSGYPGNKVLDPMGGSGMAAVAAEHLKERYQFDWHIIEKEENFRSTAIYNLNKGYQRIVLDKDPVLPSDFRSLKPGTEKWIQYWKAHPDQQDDMVAWQEKQGA